MTYREDAKGVPPDVVPVPAPHIMNAHEKTVVHHPQVLEDLRVAPELLRQERALLRAQLERLLAVDPVKVLEYCAGILRGAVFGVLAADGGAFEVIRLVYVLVRGEEVVHDDEVDLAAVGKLHAVEAVEAREQRVRVTLHVLVVLPEDSPEELVLIVVDRLDDEAVVARKVEERSRLSRRPKLG